MEYSIKELADIAKISTRTLRYYDQIRLLTPKRVANSNYRVYTSDEVDILQQILFYKQLGYDLKQIKSIINSPDFNLMSSLKSHLNNMEVKRKTLDELIENVKRTIKKEEGEIIMTDSEKFEGFKKDLIDKNEEKYGEEIREKYSNDVIDYSNKKLMNLSKEEYNEMNSISNQILEMLEQAVLSSANPKSEIGTKIAKLHKQWLSYTWPTYNLNAHIGLANMYVQDERFRKYYDSRVPGCAQFLKESIENLK